MNKYTLTAEETLQLKNIQNAYYMQPSLALCDEFLVENGVKLAFNQLYNFLQLAFPKVQIILEERKKAGLINDISQTQKSIVGKSFSNLIEYVFLKNKEAGNIEPHILITSKSTAVKKFGEDFTIYVDGEQQKPDCDLVIYNSVTNKFIILSLKTSLRERAGQTYKWKLLLEIAHSSSDIKAKYDIEYKGKNIPLVCFATVNFYNEINNPQQRGMFKFFDKAFIAKEVEHGDFIADFSTLPTFIKENL
ncbi:MAG: BsaWI family type II restriction enzyme [Spirochaetaceae bacterium]|nr:BsaWI family type II restriction enzyme [Spirochaetaceae bacterium]